MSATTTEQAVTLEELLIARMSRAFSGEIVATGATLLSYLAAFVAKVVHDPDIVLVGGSLAAFDCAPPPKVVNDEFVAARTSHNSIDWVEYFDIISADRFRIFLGPAQLDRMGNSNISVLGDWAAPTVALVGARGIPDDMLRVSELFFHVAKHSPRVFVEKVDFVCGLGYGPERERLGLEKGVPSLVVSDLGVFRFHPLGGLVVESLHPGVDLETVRARTGFPVLSDGTPPETAPPTPEELHAIREVVDPFGLRRLENGSAPPDLFPQVLAWEAAMRNGDGDEPSA